MLLGSYNFTPCSNIVPVLVYMCKYRIFLGDINDTNPKSFLYNFWGSYYSRRDFLEVLACQCLIFSIIYRFYCSGKSANIYEFLRLAICEKSLLLPPISKVYLPSTLKSPCVLLYSFANYILINTFVNSLEQNISQT